MQKFQIHKIRKKISRVNGKRTNLSTCVLTVPSIRSGAVKQIYPIKIRNTPAARDITKNKVKRRSVPQNSSSYLDSYPAPQQPKIATKITITPRITSPIAMSNNSSSAIVK